MTPKQFIEKAIEGGWKARGVEIGGEDGWKSLESMMNFVQIEEILLDPLAWSAVGKVEGWSDDGLITGINRKYMHRMVDALCAGKSIEQFLETL